MKDRGKRSRGGSDGGGGGCGGGGVVFLSNICFSILIVMVKGKEEI